MDPLTGKKITKISQVAPQVTCFCRDIGLSDYYTIKLFDSVGMDCIGMIKDDPYWLLDEFSHIGFSKADEIAGKLGINREDPRRLKAGIRFVLAYSVSDGSTYALREEFVEKCSLLLDVSREKINDTVDTMTFEGVIQPAVNETGESVYFFTYYKAECKVASRLINLAGQRPDKLKKIIASPESFLRKFEDERGIELSEEQRRAVLSSLVNGVTVITGGPGTGKTTIINASIFIMEQSGHRVAVSAPTGRAAKRIMETGGHFAQTVHRLLEYYYDETRKAMSFGKNCEDPLKYDCVIVDEASMMDIRLCEALCDAIIDGTRLIFVGDKDQLPSVGAGNVLADLIKSGCFNTIVLDRIYRQDDQSCIVMNAHRINRGEYPVFTDEKGSDFTSVKMDKQKDIQDKICELASCYDHDKVQVLTPSRKGILGTQELNSRLQQVFNPPEPDRVELKFGKKIFREGDRVMQIKNDYSLGFKRERHDKYGGDGTEEGYTREDGKGIFNGEVGTIVGIDREAKSMTVAFDDDSFGRTWGRRFALYEYTKLDELEHAFAITVHKSQGSEYPVIIIPVSWFPPVLATRSLIYTAITRGKSCVIAVGNPDYINVMVDNDRSGMRLSGLCDRLRELDSNAY